MVVTVTLLLLLLFLVIRMPVGFALGAAGSIGLYLLGGASVALSFLSTTPLTTASNYPLMTIPMFILMAQFVIVSGFADDLFEAFNAWVGSMRGGLGIAAIGTGAAFGAISGSSVAAAATLAGTAEKSMAEHRYNRSLSTGLVAIVGTLAVLIPPSNVIVIYGLLTGTAIGPLLIAGIIPGLIASVALIICLQGLLIFKPSLAPTSPLDYSIGEKLTLLKGVGPIIVLFMLVTGVLFIGIATPVEAASLGAFGAMLFVVIRRKMSWRVMRESLFSTARITAMITMIILGAHIFGYFLTLTQTTQTVIEFLSTLDMSRWTILAMILVIYLILGCFMDQIAILVLTLPLTLPVIVSLGFDPIWFGIIIVLTAEIGLITPPLGLNAFVVSNYTGLPLGTVFRGVFPFFCTMLLVLIFLVIFPQFVLWLPSLML